jgi:hypothetical protein
MPPHRRLLALIVATAAAMSSSATAAARNVLGGPLKSCCTQPLTGFYRNGVCATGPSDTGRHVVCARVTADFLSFSLSRGNDLVTPRPPSFPGLVPGDGWCLCASRWREAYEAGVAPPVDLAATNAAALRYVPLAALMEHATPGSEAAARVGAEGVRGEDAGVEVGGLV